MYFLLNNVLENLELDLEKGLEKYLLLFVDTMYIYIDSLLDF